MRLKRLPTSKIVIDRYPLQSPPIASMSKWYYPVDTKLEKNGWKTSTKSPVKNQDLWQRLDLLNHQLKPEWRWIKGHAGHQYNERCDILAVNARDQVI